MVYSIFEARVLYELYKARASRREENSKDLTFLVYRKKPKCYPSLLIHKYLLNKFFINVIWNILSRLYDFKLSIISMNLEYG